LVRVIRLHEDLYTFMISRPILCRMRNVSHKICKENQNPHLRSKHFFAIFCPLYYNMENYGRSRMATDNGIIRRLRFACCITKATDTQSEYVILIAFPR